MKSEEKDIELPQEHGTIDQLYAKLLAEQYAIPTNPTHPPMLRVRLGGKDYEAAMEFMSGTGFTDVLLGIVDSGSSTPTYTYFAVTRQAEGDPWKESPKSYHPSSPGDWQALTLSEQCQRLGLKE